MIERQQLIKDGRVTFDGVWMEIQFDDDATPLRLDLSEQGDYHGTIPADGARVRIVLTRLDDDTIDVVIGSPNDD